MSTQSSYPARYKVTVIRDCLGALFTSAAVLQKQCIRPKYGKDLREFSRTLEKASSAPDIQTGVFCSLLSQCYAWGELGTSLMFIDIQTHKQTTVIKPYTETRKMQQPLKVSGLTSPNLFSSSQFTLIVVG